MTAPFVQTIEIGAVSTYNRYFAQHPITGKLLDMNTNTQMQNVAWDTLRIADPYQSVFVTHARPNGGELYATKDALRTGQTPKWSRIAVGVGELFLGEIAVSSNLEHIFVASGSGLWRIVGLADVYSSDPNFLALTDLRLGSAPMITKTQLYSGSLSGLAINPNNPGDVVITLSGIGSTAKVERSTTANTTTNLGSFQSIFGNLPVNIAYNDALIDVDDPNHLLVVHQFGVWASQDGGATWTEETAGMGNVSVARIIQNWRLNSPNTTKPGEIYLATQSGIFSTGECTDFASLPHFQMNDQHFDMLIYPNPSNDKTTLQISSSQSGYVQIQVFNVSGMRVFEQNVYLDAEIQEIEVSTSTFESGFYFVTINLGNAQLSRKLMKL